MRHERVTLSPVKCVSRVKTRCRAAQIPSFVVCRVANATSLGRCRWAGHPASVHAVCGALPVGVAPHEALQAACVAYFDADHATEIRNNRVALFAPVMVLCGCALLAAVYMAIQRKSRHHGV